MEKVFCPLCDTRHALQKKSCLETTIIKGEEVEYEAKYFFCEKSKEDSDCYESGALQNENLLRARDAYRQKRDLLTSVEIVALRKDYGLTQVDLAKLLGWGEVTITRYETKAIQDEAHDTVLRLVRENPVALYNFLERNRESFFQDRYVAIEKNILNRLEEGGTASIKRQPVEGAYLRFREPSIENGFAVFDEEKFVAVVSYFVSKVDHLYKTKLMKMLWYADVLSFKESEAAITGLVYQHMPMGALPIAHYDLMGLPGICLKEEEGLEGCVNYLLLPNGNADYSLLTEKEKMTLDQVIKKFKDMNTRDIVEYMHKEKAYLETDDEEIIRFSFAEYVSLD